MRFAVITALLSALIIPDAVASIVPYCPSGYVYVRGADCISTDRAVQSLMSHGSPGFFVSDNLKCHEDTDCPPKYYCDHAEGVCIPEPHVECHEDKDCAPGYYCDRAEGLCKRNKTPPKCQKDVDCQTGYYCDHEQCKPLPKCDCSHDNCPNGYYCLDRKCASMPMKCKYDVDCPCSYHCACDKCESNN